MSVNSMPKENKMGTMPVKKLIFNMALPLIISMLIQALYNIVDQFFIGNLMIVYIFMGQDDGISTVGFRFAARIIISDGRSFSLEIMMLLERINELGTTLLVVTHEMGFAREVSNRVIFIDDGKIQEDEPPQELFTNPKHPRLKAFLSKML